MEHIDKTEPFGNQSDDLRGALHMEHQYATRFREERNEARAEITRVLSELVACQDERAALRARVELLKISVETLQDTVKALQAQRDFLEKQSNPQACERCGSTYQVTFEPDPYQEDINDDHTPVWECARCRSESAADI